MRSIALAAVVLALVFGGSVARGQVVISQLYTGGSTVGYYLNDYIELLNTSNTTFTLTGYSLQYGTATSNFGTSGATIFAFPANTQIGPRRYLLIRCGTTGSSGAAVPSPDLVTFSLDMGPSGGKVALVSQTTSLGAGSTATPLPLPDSRVQDLVAYGNSNNAEGGAAANLGQTMTNNQVLVRKNSGLQDTNSNLNDFQVLAAGAPNDPRNSTDDPPISARVDNWLFY